MNKKKITTLISLFLVAGAIAAAAQNADEIVSFNNEQNVYKQHSEHIKSEMSLSVEEKANKLKDKASKYDFPKLLRSKGYYEDEVNEIVYRFIQFQSVYSLTDEETKEFYKLTKQDYDLVKLMDIFEYTINTDSFRDMKLVRKIYDKAQAMKIQSNYWIETAFDALTGRTDSVLNQAQVAAYVNDGLTIEEIYAANVMSKRNEKSVEKLLKEKKSGKKWSEIAGEVYPEISSIPDAENNPVKIVSSVMKSKVTGLEASEIMTDSSKAENLISNAQSAAETAANSIGISADELTENILSCAQEKLPTVDKKNLAKWIREGHSIRGIEKKHNESLKDGIPLEQKINNGEVE